MPERPEHVTNLDLVVAMGKLSMDEREALFDHVVRYETYREIAERLGVTVEGVRAMVERAKVKVARELSRDR